MRRLIAFVTAVFVGPVITGSTPSASAQETNTRNVALAGQIPSVQALDVEFDPDERRPYLYVADADGSVAIVSTATDGGVPTVARRWEVGDGATTTVVDVEHFRVGNREYLAAGLSMENGQGAVAVAEITSLRSDVPIREIARTETAAVTDLFAYKHSSGVAVLAVADGGPLRLFDAGSLTASGEPLATIETPEQLERSTSGFDYVYVGYHPATESDRLYGAGAGGYHVFDITDPAAPAPVATVNPATIRRGGAAVPTPDGRFVVSSAGYRGSPVRIFDLQPVFDGELRMVRTAESAWAANWKNMCADFEMRWPLVFAAATADGLQVFNMRSAAAPYTVGWYRTSDSSSAAMAADVRGAQTVDVRNHDGLIAVGDRSTGLWFFNLQGFQGWTGHGYGLPNVSSEQDWVSGPDRVGGTE